MRHVPPVIDGISMDPPAEVIADATPRHLPQGELYHIEGLRFLSSPPVAEQKIKDGRARKFRRRTEPSLLGIEAGRQLLVAILQPFQRQGAGLRRLPFPKMRFNC